MMTDISSLPDLTEEEKDLAYVSPIRAIKAVRARTNLSLWESKRRIDTYLDSRKCLQQEFPLLFFNGQTHNLRELEVQLQVLRRLAEADSVRCPSIGLPVWERYHYGGDFTGMLAEGWKFGNILYTSQEWPHPPPSILIQIVVLDLSQFFPVTVNSPEDLDLRALHAIALHRIAS